MSKRSILPCLLVLLYLSGLGLAAWATRNCSPTTQIGVLQTAAIVLTGLVIIWYTWETRRLGIETRRQTEVQQRPFVVVEPTKNGFEIKNVGRGPALNVTVDDVQITPPDSDETIVIRFPRSVPLLSSNGQPVPLEAESFKDDRSWEDFFFPHLDPQYADLTLSLRIKFQNVESRHYAVEEKVVPGKLEIVGFREI